jgi:hypothetical protein
MPRQAAILELELELELIACRLARGGDTDSRR